MTEISEGVISSLKSEYLSILILIVAWILINAAAIWFADKKKLGFGIAVIFAYVRFFGTIAAVVILCVIRPIWILVRDRSEFLNVKPVILCVLCITALLLPAVISVFVLLFGKKIMERREYRREHEGKDMYTVEPADYKSAGDFKRELDARGLFYSDDYKSLLMQINGRYQDFSRGVYGFNFFPPATITTLRSEEYEDAEFKNKAIHPDSETKAPAYLYNVMLFRPEGSDKLQYVPFEYTRHQRYPQKNDPIYTEFFVISRIAYVDGDIYAIIGVGESKVIEEHFGMFSRPYYMVLSEKKNITTYFEGKYFPYGALHIETNGFKMQPNTREESYGYPMKPVNYPVRVVRRLDVDAINNVAAELMEGVLKDVGADDSKK